MNIIYDFLLRGLEGSTIISWRRCAMFLLVSSSLFVVACSGGNGEDSDGGGSSNTTISDSGNGTVSDSGNGTMSDSGNGTVSDTGNGTVSDSGNGTVSDTDNGTVSDTDNGTMSDTDNGTMSDMPPGDPGDMNAPDIDNDGDGLIEITTFAELDAMRYQLDGSGLRLTMNGDLSQAGCGETENDVCNGYELVNDITIPSSWIPIGDDNNPTDGLCWGDEAFTAILDGNGWTIKGLNIDQSANDCIGFFAQLKDTTVRNLTIEATTIIGLKNVGVLAGWAQNVTIDNVHTRSQSLKGAQAVGGLIGRIHADDGQAIVTQHESAASLPVVVPPEDEPSIKDSSARSNEIIACASAGGLVGESDRIMIQDSYAISQTISLPFNQATESTDINCVGVRVPYYSYGDMGQHQVTHHIYQSIGGLVGDGDSSLWQGSGSQWDTIYGSDDRPIINIGDFLVQPADDTRFPNDGTTTTTYGDLILKSIVEGGTRIVSSYAISGELTGNWKIGGLMGDGNHSLVQDSYAITKDIHARIRTAGGLIGQAEEVDILHSYAITGRINANGSTTGSDDGDKANGEAGGLIGRAKGNIDLQSTYAVANLIIGGEENRSHLGSAGGLLGSRYKKDANNKINYTINNSYVIFRDMSGFQHRPLVGRDTLDNVLLDDTYWDTNATLHRVFFHTNFPISGLRNQRFSDYSSTPAIYEDNPRPSASLQTGLDLDRWSDDFFTPIFVANSDIYSEWKRADCDSGGAVWDFGTNTEYPAIRCTPDEPADQRSYYSLDENNKSQVDTNLIDQTIQRELQ